MARVASQPRSTAPRGPAPGGSATTQTNVGASPQVAAQQHSVQHHSAQNHTTQTNLRHIELILSTIDQLPTLSAVAVQILNWGSAGEVDIDAGAQLIESDPALAARILALCTRADKGMAARVTTVKHAVVMLGIETVRSAALSVAVFDLLRSAQRANPADKSEGSEQGSEQGFDREEYWRFCVAVGSACEALTRAQKTVAASPANNLKTIVPGQAFLAGLLSGLGRLALAWALPASYDRVVKLARVRGVATSSVERELLGIDHHACGRRLAQRWGLPQAITDCMWLHDAPPEAIAHAGEHAPLVTLVTAARAIARSQQLGDGCDANEHPSLQGACVLAGLASLPGAQVEALAANVRELYEHRVQVLGLKARTTQQDLAHGLARATQRLTETASAQARVVSSAKEQDRASELARILAVAASDQWTIERAALTLLTGLQRASAQAACAVLLGVRGSWRVWQSSAASDQQGRTLELPGSVATALEGLFLPGVTLPALGVLQWLADELSQLPDVRELRVQPAASDDATGLRVLVIAPEQALSPLLHAKEVVSALLLQAARSEEARSLHEKLVNTQRELATSQAAASHAQSMVRLGQTTAGAAHEMNTPLAVIVGRAQLLLTRLRDERDKAAVQAIAGSARQISDLISSLHVLSTPPTPTLAPTALRDAIDQAIVASQGRLCSDVSVQVHLPSTDGAAMYALTDGVLITRILTELITNAMEACPKGPIAVHARWGDAVPAASESRAALLTHDVILEVRDDGRGPSEAALTHAFDPFFSERPAGRGKGLGLSRARAIAQAMGGNVRLVSAQSVGLARGAIAVVRLPMQRLERPAMTQNRVK